MLSQTTACGYCNIMVVLPAQKVNPEIVRIAGRWRSLAYEVYIRAFEQVASRHLGGLLSQSQIQ